MTLLPHKSAAGEARGTVQTGTQSRPELFVDAQASHVAHLPAARLPGQRTANRSPLRHWSSTLVIRAGRGLRLANTHVSGWGGATKLFCPARAVSRVPRSASDKPTGRRLRRHQPRVWISKVSNKSIVDTGESALPRLRAPPRGRQLSGLDLVAG